MSVSSSGSVNGGPSNPPNKGYQTDTLNPYFLHPNENPGNVLVTPLLSGSNYHSWSRAMQVALRSKHKLHFINGSLPRPIDEDHDSIALGPMQHDDYVMDQQFSGARDFSKYTMDRVSLRDMAGPQRPFLSR
jgi:hypothetical protein